jgi:hypothetical protein
VVWTTPTKCGCSTKTGACSNDATGTFSIPCAPGTLADAKTGEPNTKIEYSKLHVCDVHKAEAIHVWSDTYEPGSAVTMKLCVDEQFITITFPNGVSYQVVNQRKEESEDVAAEFLSGLAAMGYDFAGAGGFSN